MDSVDRAHALLTGESRAGLRREHDRNHRGRFVVALAFSVAWTTFSIWVSRPWLEDLGKLTHPLLALVALTFIAYVPGFMNVFLLASLLLEPRRQRQKRASYPEISILIAAYNEEEAIGATLQSLAAAGYPAAVEVVVVDDGSHDGTSLIVEACTARFGAEPLFTIRLVRLDENGGKARALNTGLVAVRNQLVVTLDADTRLESGSLTTIVERLLGDPLKPVAIAGSVLVGNPGDSLIAGAQQWDYFHGIAAVKRMQSMYGGTLVAQGAFSIYFRDVLVEAGGWPDTVGEDIVLTWALLKRGLHVGYAEDAVAWTRVPRDLAALARQRKRWARGMIEALDHHRSILFLPRLTTMFVWWNLLFISLDSTFTLIFIPGLVLAICGLFWLAGPITLLVLPLAALWNIAIYRIQSRVLRRLGVRMERNWLGFVAYVGVYPLLMQPVSVWGYLAEMTGRSKQWGTP